MVLHHVKVALLNHSDTVVLVTSVLCCHGDCICVWMKCVKGHNLEFNVNGLLKFVPQDL